MSLRNQIWEEGSVVCFFRNSQEQGRIKAGHRWTDVACCCVYKNQLLETNKNAIVVILNHGWRKEEKYMGKLFNSKIRERRKDEYTCCCFIPNSIIRCKIRDPVLRKSKPRRRIYCIWPKWMKWRRTTCSYWICCISYEISEKTRK